MRWIEDVSPQAARTMGGDTGLRAPLAAYLLLSYHTLLQVCTQLIHLDSPGSL
jgi:hypothetical protein